MLRPVTNAAGAALFACQQHCSQREQHCSHALTMLLPYRSRLYVSVTCRGEALRSNAPPGDQRSGSSIIRVPAALFAAGAALFACAHNATPLQISAVCECDL